MESKTPEVQRVSEGSTVDQQTKPIPLSDQIDERILGDRFELLEEVASGGMGNVWRARDLREGAIVALKLLISRREGDAIRFQREAKVLADLSHPAIVRYVDHGQTTGNRLYIAMEWLEGEDLANRLAFGQPMSTADCVAVAKRTAEALAAAHRLEIVHRDIKPSNLFLPFGDSSRTKVLDFGIARMAFAHQLTRSGVSVGTPGYMAPEQARGGREVDGRADIFSLGCVLHECLTGRPAFSGGPIVSVLAKILLEEVPRVSLLRSTVPQELDELVARMLSKSPGDRPANAADVVSVLESVRLVEEGRASVPELSRAITRKEQRLVSVVMAAPREKTAEAVMVHQDATEPRISVSPEVMRDIRRRFEAQVETLADGSMVVMLSGGGAPIEQAARAARCALGLQGLFDRVPVVVITGKSVVGARLPTGEVIDRAARVLKLARDGNVYLDDVTAGLLEGRFEFEEHGGLKTLRGEREHADGSRLLLGKPTPCVGRERELAMLDAIWEQCVTEPGTAAVLVTGSAGMGKSRLRQEFERRVRSRNPEALVLVGSGDPVAPAGAFSMLAPALRRAAGVLDGEATQVQRDKIRERLGVHLSEENRNVVVEFLGELAGISFDDRDSVQLRSARLDPVLMGDQMRSAWDAWIQAEAKLHPVLIILEDLHWGDLPTVRYINAVLQRRLEAPLMVVALARGEVHQRFPGLWQDLELTEMRLRGLSRRAAQELISTVLGDEMKPEAVAQLIDRADGNAFHLEELIRAEAEGRRSELPDSVLGMVQARLDALEPETRRVLRASSLFGRSFWRGGVQCLLGDAFGSHELDEHLAILRGAELIVKQPRAVFSGEDQYELRHELLREAAYAMLTDSDRILGHRLAGAWLEENGERDPMVLADHLQRGGELERASGWYRRAAEEALEGNDLDAAIERARSGIECGAVGEVRGWLRLFAAESHGWKAEFHQSATYASEAATLFEEGTPPWFRSLGQQVFSTGPLGRKESALKSANALRDVEPEATHEARSSCTIARSMAVAQLVVLGEYELAKDLLERAERDVSQLVLDDPVALGRVHLGHGFLALGRGELEAAVDHLRASEQEFLRGGAIRNACSARANLGLALLELGQVEDAEQVLRRTLEDSERLGLEFSKQLAQLYLGHSMVRRGAVPPQVLRAQLASKAHPTEDQRVEGYAKTYFVELFTYAGDLNAAEMFARQAIDELVNFPPLQARAFVGLARVLGKKGQHRDALRVAHQAMDLLGQLGGTVWESAVRLIWIETLEAVGETQKAAQALTEAVYRVQTRAASIRDPEKRKSFLERVPENVKTLNKVVL